jgi:hypothetical protein
LNPEKKLNECPKCHRKTKFVPICVKAAKGKADVLLGRYKCSECNWQSELQEPDVHPPIRPKNPVYLTSHYFKEDKMLFISVYTTEKITDPSKPDYMNTDRHLLTVTVTPHSLGICPNVPFSLQNKRSEEGLMFLQDNKDLIASPCAECSQEQRNECLDSKEPCKKTHTRQG